MRAPIAAACLALTLLTGPVRAEEGPVPRDRNPFKTHWIGWEQALRKGGPILIYRQDRATGNPALCGTETAQRLSRKYAFVRIPYARDPGDLDASDRELLQAYGFDRKPALLVMTDRFGNELSRLGGGLNEPRLQPLFAQAERDAEALEGRLARKLEQAASSEAGGDLARAVRGYRELMEYRGLPPVETARRSLEALFGRVRAEIEVLTAPGADPVPALRTLKAWQGAFRGTELEEALEEALRDLAKPPAKP